MQILHLEDSQLDHELIQRLLSRAEVDAQITRAGSRAEFVRLFDDRPWDLILADYEIPGYDGVSALHHVRKTRPDLPFIFVSGVLGEEIAIETLRNGATDYVLKARLERLPTSVARAFQEQKERARRRAAEEALLETEHRFEAMANAAPVLLWIVGPTRNRQFFNRSWLEFTGRSLAEELNGAWVDCVHPDDLLRWTEVFDLHFTRRDPFTTELRLLRADRQYRWLVMNASPRFSASGEFWGMIGSAIDLTELKQTEQRLLHVAKLESLGVMAGGIAHDFNNLLTGIIGHAELLKEELSANDTQASIADHILQAGNVAAQLTRQMLAYSGRGLSLVEPVDLTKVVHLNRTLIDASVPRNVRLDFDLEETLPSISADPGQVQQVVMNLIINATEASDKNGGVVRVRTYVHWLSETQEESNLTGDPLPPGPYVVIEVSDNGVGMDVSTQARIFDPFFTTKFTGRGLGLAAVLGIVRGHKAGLRLRSEPNCGSTFSVLFPQTVSLPAPATHKADQRVQTGTVFVVEDESIVRNAIRLALTRSRFSFVTAESGHEALEKLNDSFDVALIDLMMPGMGGQDLLARIRSQYPGMQVIGMSGFSEAEALARFGGELDGFLQKPFTGSRVVERIAAVLNSRTPG